MGRAERRFNDWLKEVVTLDINGNPLMIARADDLESSGITYNQDDNGGQPIQTTDGETGVPGGTHKDYAEESTPADSQENGGYKGGLQQGGATSEETDKPSAIRGSNTDSEVMDAGQQDKGEGESLDTQNPEDVKIS